MDDWPERIGIGSLRDVQRMLGWIEECLAAEERQLRAKAKLKEAIIAIQAAVEILEGKL